MVPVWGLERRDWLWVAGYALCGFLLFSICSSGAWMILAATFGRSSAPVKLLMEVQDWLGGPGKMLLLINSVLGVVRAFLWAVGFAGSSLWLLGAGPNEERMRTGKVLLLSAGLSVLATLGFAFQDYLPERVFGAWKVAAIFVLPAAWCLTWALDAVRRQVALDRRLDDEPDDEEEIAS